MVQTNCRLLISYILQHFFEFVKPLSLDFIRHDDIINDRKRCDFMKKKIIIGIICLFVALGIGVSIYNKIDTPPETTAISGKDETGKGETSFDFSVIDVDGKETKLTVRTDKKTVGEALLDAGLISGEDGPYGMYVKSVNGITLDYDTHGKYWAFYTNGEYSTTGVDKTEIEKDKVYTFKAE